MLAPATNLGTAVRRTRMSTCAHWDRLAFCVENIFPHKTAWNLAALTGLQVRACFQFLARKSSLSSDAVVALLHTDHGFECLRALMGDARPTWWKELKAAAELEQIKRERDALNARIEAMERK